MEKKKLLLVIFIILFLLLVSVLCIYTSQNNHEINNSLNNTTNNTKMNKLNNTVNSSVNNSINNASNNLTIENHDKTKHSYHHDKVNNKKDSKKHNKSIDEAMEAKLAVEKYCTLGKNEVAGYPVYKDPTINSWLVPIFDKTTGKFKGSIYVCNGGDFFVSGPDSYSAYKNEIKGKTNYKLDPNKYSRPDNSTPPDNVSEWVDIVLIGKANPNSYSDVPLVTDMQNEVILDNSNVFDLEKDEIIVDSDNADNSTC